MGTEKRARQKARTQARREAEKEAAARAKRKRTTIRVGVVALAIVGIFLGITLSGRDDEPTVTTVPPPVGAEVTAEAPGTADEATDRNGGPTEDMTDEMTDDMIGDQPIGSTTVPATTADAPAETSDETSTPPEDPDDPDETSETPAETPEDPAPAEGPEAPVAGGPNYTPYATEDYGSEPCAPEGGVSEPVLDFAGAPMLCIDTSLAHTVVLETSRGIIRVALDAANTPGTVNSFVNLARFGYYDGTLIHRSAPSIGILQGGSPHTNNAADPGPGYTLWDEGTGFTYRPGQLVMARRGEPNSAGAQYFFTVTPDAGLLDGQGTYVVFGEVVEGLDVLVAILDSHVDEPNNPLGGSPDPPVVVDSLRIEVG